MSASRTITFSYNNSKLSKPIKVETPSDQDLQNSVATESEQDSHFAPVEGIEFDEQDFKRLDKQIYPFSSKYTPRKHGEGTDILNKNSLLLRSLSRYTEISRENESKWGEESLEIVKSLKSWRRLYKILDRKKRHLKKLQNNTDNDQSKTSSGGNESDSASSSSNELKRSIGNSIQKEEADLINLSQESASSTISTRSNKRRRTNSRLTETSDENNSSGSSSERKPTRTARRSAHRV